MRPQTIVKILSIFTIALVLASCGTPRDKDRPSPPDKTGAVTNMAQVPSWAAPVSSQSSIHAVKRDG